MAAHAPSLEGLPPASLEYIVRQVVIVEESWIGLRILPLVSRTLLARLQDFSLPVGRLRGEQAVRALQKGRWAADRKRAWKVGELDLRNTRVTKGALSTLEGCSSLHTLSLRGTAVTKVSALAGCSSLHTLDLGCTGVTDVSALAG